MSMQHLAAEIAKPEYKNLTDQQIADAVNAKTVVVKRLVPTYLVRQKACEGFYWSDLEDACSSENVTLKKIARSMMVWIDDKSGTIQTVDMTLPSVAKVVGGLVSFGIITQPQADALSALADASIPWTESVGLPEVGVGLIINARRIANG